MHHKFCVLTCAAGIFPFDQATLCRSQTRPAMASGSASANLPSKPPRRKYAIKYKTALCTFYSKAGNCARGDRCAFAHGEEDLCFESENWKCSKTGVPYKTRRCHFFPEGKCNRGADCRFAHVGVDALVGVFSSTDLLNTCAF